MPAGAGGSPSRGRNFRIGETQRARSARSAHRAVCVHGGRRRNRSVGFWADGFAPRLQVLNTAEKFGAGEPHRTSISRGTSASVRRFFFPAKTAARAVRVVASARHAAAPTAHADQPLTGQWERERWRFLSRPARALAFLCSEARRPTGACYPVRRNARKTISEGRQHRRRDYQLPAVQSAYRVEVHASGWRPVYDFRATAVCPGGAALCPPLNSLRQRSCRACTASSSAGGQPADGPGTNYAALATLGAAVQVVGQWTNGGWYAVNAARSSSGVGVGRRWGDCKRCRCSNVNRACADAGAASLPTHQPQCRPTPRRKLNRGRIARRCLTSSSTFAHHKRSRHAPCGHHRCERNPTARPLSLSVSACVDGFANEIGGVLRSEPVMFTA